MTPNEAADTDKRPSLPAPQTDVQPLRFLGLLIHEPAPAVILHGSKTSGCGITPARSAIVANGSHAELLRQGGLYAELWRRQSGDFKRRAVDIDHLTTAADPADEILEVIDYDHGKQD